MIFVYALFSADTRLHQVVYYQRRSVWLRHLLSTSRMVAPHHMQRRPILRTSTVRSSIGPVGERAELKVRAFLSSDPAPRLVSARLCYGSPCRTPTIPSRADLVSTGRCSRSATTMRALVVDQSLRMSQAMRCSIMPGSVPPAFATEFSLQCVLGSKNRHHRKVRPPTP